jgi:hypothetical protein
VVVLLTGRGRRSVRGLLRGIQVGFVSGWWVAVDERAQLG